MWIKVKAWFKNSLTILWARIVAVGGLALTMAVNLSADPAVGGAVQAVLQPKYIPYYVIGIGVLTELARRRTVGKATNADNRVVGG